MPSSASTLQFPIPSHQFEEADGVARGMDAADFVGVDGADEDGFDAKTFATGDEEHLGFVIETVGAAEQLGDEIAMHHAKAALRVGNVLAANTTDSVAHVTIDGAAEQDRKSVV